MTQAYQLIRGEKKATENISSIFDLATQLWLVGWAVQERLWLNMHQFCWQQSESNLRHSFTNGRIMLRPQPALSAALPVPRWTPRVILGGKA